KLAADADEDARSRSALDRAIAELEQDAGSPHAGSQGAVGAPRGVLPVTRAATTTTATSVTSQATPEQPTQAPLAASSPPPSTSAPGDGASGPHGQTAASPPPGTLFSRPLPGQATLRLLEPSIDLMVAAGWSTANDAEIRTLQGGAHDPDRRGFTFQQAELGFFGAVDPYFDAVTYILFTPD